jgi:hypothetical protein
MKRIGTTYVADSIIDPRDLVAVQNRLVLPDVPNLIARQVARVASGYPRGTETIAFYRYTRQGAAKIFSHTGADNVPLVNAYKTRQTQSVVTISIGFQVSKNEKDAAQMTGDDVVGKKTDDCKLYASIRENDLFFNGSTPHGILGLLNFTGIQLVTIPNGVSGFSYWANKTAMEVLADIMLVWKAVQGRDGYRATMLLLNTEMATRYLYQFLDSTKDSRTVIEVIREMGMFPAGIVTSDGLKKSKLVVLQNTADILENALVYDLEANDPYRVNGYTEEIDFDEKYGGGMVYKPLGVAVGSTINSTD